MPLSPPIASLLKQFHARKPARIWSLIVTLYGDAIVPRGGSLWIGSLIEIMALFRIDAGHVRTAVSRLSSDGWLASTKRGRASYYRLSRERRGRVPAGDAAHLFRRAGACRARCRSPSIGPAARDPAALRAALEIRRLRRRVAGHCMSASASVPAALSGIARAVPDDAARKATGARWPRPPSGWMRCRRPIAISSRSSRRLPNALANRPSAEADALVARTLLIHAFRRVVLRDPGLPRDLLPADWQGDAARALAARIYAQVVRSV